MHAHREILRHAFGLQRFACGVRHLGHTQAVIKLEAGNVQIFQGGEPDLRAGRNLVGMWVQVGVDLIVVDLQAHLLRAKSVQAANDY